jgi:hypothetical protein
MKKISIFAAFIGCAMLVSSCDGDNKNGDGNKTDPSTIASDALIAYFPFDGNGNDVKGGLAPSNTATTTSTFVNGGMRGQCYRGGSELTCGLLYPLPDGSQLKNLKQFAFSVWVKLDPNTTATTHDPEQMIFQIDGSGDWVWGNLFLLQHRNFPQNDPTDPSYANAEMDCYFWRDDAASWKGQRANGWRLNVMEPQWRHIICSYNSATSEFHGYVNGVEIVSPDTTVYNGVHRWQGEEGTEARLPFGELKFNDAQNLVIGAWAERLKGASLQTDVWAASMRGLIDEFRIYNRGLTKAEAEALYKAELSQTEE